MEIDGKHEVVGFYTTRVVDAPDEQRARHEALRIVRAELGARVVECRSARERIEIDEVTLAQPLDPSPQGFTFYRDDEKEA